MTSLLTQCNVVKDGITEQKHILKHHADILSQPSQFIFIDINTIDEYSPTVDLIKTVKQINYRRLPCTGSSNKSNCFPGLDIKVDVFQNIFSVVVSKPDVLEISHRLAHVPPFGFHYPERVRPSPIDS